MTDKKKKGYVTYNKKKNLGRNIQGQTYDQQTEDYRNKFSADEFTARQSRQGLNIARNKASGDTGRLTMAQLKETRAANPVSHTNRLGKKDVQTQYFAKGEDGKRVLTDLSKENDPFRVDNLEDFDLSAYGAGAARRQEVLNINDIRGLRNRGGFSMDQISEYAAGLEGDQKVGGSAKKMLAKYKNKIAAQNKGGGTGGTGDTGGAAGDAGDAGAAEKAENLKNDYVKGITQTQSFDREFGDNQNTIGNENKIYGNLNQGNQDFSVNIGAQGSGSGTGGGSLSNMQSAAAYGALNENAYERSRAKVSGMGRASQAIGAAEDMIKPDERVEGLDEETDNLSTYYREMAKKQNVMAFGDYMSPYYEAPKWNSPAAPAEITVDAG